MSSSALPRPESRYGASQPSSRPIKAWGNKLIATFFVLLLLALLVVVVRYMGARNSTPVSASIAGFERVTNEQITTNVDVTRKDPEVASYCIITALNYDRAEVGRRELLIPPGGVTTARYTVLINTRDIPVATSVYGCATTIPHHMGL
ncbi:DUF4307 domain-containing protein [Corynebacterium caspium]|uniref:DUF4307 domain-containing protein n=1 Tax=Corynebacterium caspium TaxID=234828 RepID=UPI00037B2712|nr:DUF4307 domain-containing protein [Corynebacterium caspium]WKD59559.1 hypothetical protein CCASP_05860 [Corynebacterium caspium DSM 44850]